MKRTINTGTTVIARIDENAIANDWCRPAAGTSGPPAIREGTRQERYDNNNQRKENRPANLLGSRQEDLLPLGLGYRLAFQRCLMLRFG